MNFYFNFNFYALILFIIIMLPNMLWFKFPSKNDVLRKESITPKTDKVMSIVQVLMIIAFVLISNRNDYLAPINFKTICIIISVVFIILYLTSWCLYYKGNVSKVVLLSLCLFPCLAFIFYTIAFQNWIGLVLSIIYAFLHLIFTLKNFILESE